MPISSAQGTTLRKYEEDTSEIITFTIDDLLDGVSDAESTQDSLLVENLNSNKGTIEALENNKWKLTPEANYNGSITLSYVISDENGGKTFTTRKIEIEAVNDKPELKEGAQTTLKPIKEEGTIKIYAEDILKNYGDKDGEVLSIADGQLRLSDNSAGKLEGNADDGWTFTAAKDYSGTTSFEFEIQDNESKIPGAVTLERTRQRFTYSIKCKRIFDG